MLAIPENQEKFRIGEGFELMIRCLSEQKYAASCAIRVINYAVIENKANAIKLVEVGGMKYLFPMLLGRSLPKITIAERKKSRSQKEKKELEEQVSYYSSNSCTQIRLYNIYTNFRRYCRSLVNYVYRFMIAMKRSMT